MNYSYRYVKILYICGDMEESEVKSVKKYKKMVLLLLVSCMMLLVCACGNTDSDQKRKDETADNKQVSQETRESDGQDKQETTAGRVELKMVFWDSNQEPGLIAMAEGFTKQNPNISVSVETTPFSEYWMKLQAAAQGNSLPDIIVMHPDQVENFAQGGILMELSDILDGEIANRNNFPDYVVEDFQVDGKYYGIPKDIGTLGLFYNKDLFDAAGMPYPDSTWTWEELTMAAEKLTDKEKGIYGLNAANDGLGFYWNLVWQNGSDVWDEEKNLCTFDAPATVEAMKYAVSFVEKGCSPTPADFANLSPDEYFESGKTAMHFAGSWMLTEYQNIEGLNFDVAELPKGKERAAICSGMAFSVAANTAYPEEAKKLIEYLGSEEAQTIEAESGVAIPAFSGTQTPWVDQFKDINASAFVKVEEYGHTSTGLENSASEAPAILNEYMTKVFSLELPVEEGMKIITEKINATVQ